ESELDGARFDRANLTGASFVYSTAKQSSFVSARLHDTKLLDVDLTGAVACHSSWQGAFLQQADLSTTDLSQAQIVELSAEALILDGANMHGARLTKCVFADCTLRRANFSETHLSEVSLEEADLCECRFVSVKLEHVSFD